MMKRVAFGILIAVLSLGALLPVGRLAVAGAVDNSFEGPFLQPFLSASAVNSDFEEPFLQPFLSAGAVDNSFEQPFLSRPIA